MKTVFEAVLTIVVMSFVIGFLMWGATEGYKYVGR
jgi:hypothetical protein